MRRQRTASESGAANGSENESNDPQRIRSSSDNDGEDSEEIENVTGNDSNMSDEDMER